MVRSFVLNEIQRQAIEEYIKERPNIMSSQIRQLRMRVKVLDFDQMEADVALLRRLKELKIPKGRRSGAVAAGFTVRQPKKEGDVVGGFKVEPAAPEEKK